MTLTDLIVIAVLVLILGAAIWYIIKAKKNGAKCIGCPAGCMCSRKGAASDTCSCGFIEDKDE